MQEDGPLEPLPVAVAGGFSDQALHPVVHPLRLGVRQRVYVVRQDVPHVLLQDDTRHPPRQDKPDNLLI